MKAKLLSLIFFLCAGLCIVYFGMIVGYSGFGTSLSYIWPVFACIFAAMGVMVRKLRREREEMPSFMPVFIFTSFGLMLAIFAVIMDLVVVSSKSDKEQRVDYCIVMGARVYSDGISKTLKYRLDNAEHLYFRHPNMVLVLSGGQEPGDPIPEAFAMYNYLSLRGIPSDNMLIEAMGDSTCSIIQNATRTIAADFEKRRLPKGPGDRTYPSDYVPTVGIITSDYHMFRSVTLAKENGISNPVSISAKSDDVLFIHNCVRESVAILKDFFMGNVTVNDEHMPSIPFN